MWSRVLSLYILLLTQISSVSQVPSDYDKLKDLVDNARTLAPTSPDSAVVLAEKAIAEASRFGSDSLQARALIALSTAHSYLANYEKSTAFAFDALAIGEQFSDTLVVIDAFNNLGIDYMIQEDNEKAIAYFQKVKFYSQSFNDSLRLGHALNNIGIIYGYEEEYEKELAFYDDAATIFLKIGEQTGYANTLLNTGTVYTFQGNYAKANDFFEEALEAFNASGELSGVQNTLQSQAENYFEQGETALAERVAMRALQMAEDLNLRQDVIYTNELLSKITAKKGDFRSALSFYQALTTMKEEVFNAEKSQQIAELEMKYQVEKKEQDLQIAELRISQQKLTNQALVVVFSLLAIVLFAVIFAMRQKLILRQRIQEEEIKNLKLQVSSLLGDNQEIRMDLEKVNEKLHQPLSEREFEVLSLKVSDKTNQEIAKEIFLSVNTVKFHLKNAYSKLGVSNRKEVLRFAVQLSGN